MSKTTENYGLTKPEVGEFFSLETWSENMDKIDGELKKREDAQKESDNSLMNPKFTEAKERKNLTSGEKIHLMLGKISRFFSDMKAIAFSGSYNDLVDKPKIPTVLNNQTTTEEGYALDARQANPNIDGTLAKQVADLNGSLNNNRDIIWSGQQEMTLSAVNSWEKSDKFITLQPGKYMLGFKAHTNCKDDVYIDTSIDTKEYTFMYYEKNVNMPVSTKIATDGSSTVRSVTNTFVANIIEPVELHFLCWSDHILTLTCELWALRLI